MSFTSTIFRWVFCVISIARATGGTVPYHEAELKKAYHAQEAMKTYYAGSAAKEQGLTGDVNTGVIDNLFDGYSPDRTTPWVQKAGTEERVRGWDLVETIGKGESIAGTVAGLDSLFSREVRGAERSAVALVVEVLEKLPLARRGKGGMERETAKLAIGCFEHFTSRAGDPLWHTHLLIPSIGQRGDGSHGAVFGREIFRWKMALGALVRAECAFQLRSRLGLDLKPAKVGYRIAGISDALLQEFSKRRQAIESAMSRRGWHGARASAEATLITRGKKKPLTAEQHAEACRIAAKKLGFTAASVDSLMGRSRIKLNEPQQRVAAVNDGLQAISSKHNYFTERDLIRAVSEAAIARGVSGRQVLTDVTAAMQRHPEIVRLGTRDHETYFSTRQILAAEKELLTKLEAGRGDTRHCVDAKKAEKVIRRHPKLNKEQKEAVRQITIKAGLCQVVSGYPGTGKTSLLLGAKAVWVANGVSEKHIVGLGFTGKAAQQLQDGAGIPSCTIDRYLKYNDPTRLDVWKHHIRQIVRAARKKRTFKWDALKITSQSIVVIDEASLVSRSQLLRLWNALEKQAGGPGRGPKLIFLGDGHQLQALWHPGAFDGMRRRLKHMELKNIVRQKEEWAKEAVFDFATGDAIKGLEAYASRGHLHVAPDKRAAHEALIRDWGKQTSRAPQSAIILAATNAEVRNLNTRAQEFRKQAGLLGMSSVLVEGNRFYQHDRLVFTKNNRFLGVKNGQLATIERIDSGKRALTARLDNGKRVNVPLTYYSDIALGYALTVMKAQGCTSQFAYVMAGGPMQDRELATVAMSRAEILTKIYCDRFEAGEKLSTLAKQMERSRREVLASDLEVVPSKSTANSPVFTR